MNALLVYPTHENLREVEENYLRVGIDARCYPARLTSDTKYKSQNCWNELADEAEAMGFGVVKTVCPQCKCRIACTSAGYLGELADAKNAQVALCTHKRVEYSDFPNLMEGRGFVSVHENPIDLLRPRSEASEPDLFQVHLVIDRLLTDPRYLDWFGDAVAVDDDGNTYHDEELALRRDRLYQFTHHLSEILDRLLQTVQTAVSTVEWSSPISMRRPAGIERLLFKVTRAIKVSFKGQPWRFVLSAVTGELSSAAIIVSPRFQKGAQGETELIKTAVGFRNNRPLCSATTWFNDATLSADTLSAVLGTEVSDRTPGGRLELQKKAVQILRDVTRQTSKSIFANILRGTLVDRPQFNRVGIICHRPHIEAFQLLEPPFASRIVKSAYFGSGEERSSNAWHGECDLIIVAGTPRLPQSEIAAYLVQIGHVGAACTEPEWGTIKWDGRSESGEPITVTAKGYHDPTWQHAQRDLVRAAIVQAVGRGRGILDSGCEVILLSTEECGLLISDSELKAMNGSTARILAVLNELTMENANKYILGNSIVSTSVIAKTAGLSPVRTRELLRDLEQRGLVNKVGERGGWRSAATFRTGELSPPSPGETSPHTAFT